MRTIKTSMFNLSTIGGTVPSASVTAIFKLTKTESYLRDPHGGSFEVALKYFETVRGHLRKSLADHNRALESIIENEYKGLEILGKCFILDCIRDSLNELVTIIDTVPVRHWPQSVPLTISHNHQVLKVLTSTFGRL